MTTYACAECFCVWDEHAGTVETQARIETEHFQTTNCRGSVEVTFEDRAPSTATEEVE